MKALCLFVLVFVAGCGCAPSDCTLDRLPGEWTIEYELVSGDCGPIPTGVVQEDGSRDPGNCSTYTVTVARDRCTRETNTDCPNGGNDGSQHWVTFLEQAGPDRVEGVGTVEAIWPNGQTCQSTYNLVLTRLP